MILDRTVGISVDDVSPAYQTAPVGSEADSPFLNAAARLECALSPLDLLRRLQSVEEELGRVREVRWGQRTLDLDLLIFGDIVTAQPELTIPHLHLWYRRFVLDPLVDIAADVRHPLLGVAVRELRDTLVQRPLTVAILGATPDERHRLTEVLTTTHPEIVIVTAPDIEAAITLDLGSEGDLNSARHGGRVVSLDDLPGRSLLESAESVLAAALDEPVRHKRPLRRMP